jgi:hypothetical protein
MAQINTQKPLFVNGKSSEARLTNLEKKDHQNALVTQRNKLMVNVGSMRNEDLCATCPPAVLVVDQLKEL